MRKYLTAPPPFDYIHPICIMYKPNLGLVYIFNVCPYMSSNERLWGKMKKEGREKKKRGIGKKKKNGKFLSLEVWLTPETI